MHILDFLSLLVLDVVDLGGFSPGGAFVQLIALNSPPGQIRRLIVADSSPGFGEDVTRNTPERQTKVTEHAAGPIVEYDNIFHYLFYLPTQTPQAAGRAWWQRIHERNTVEKASNTWLDPAQRNDGSYDRLGDLKLPTFIVQGRSDAAHHQLLHRATEDANARLKLYPDSGHGFLFQFAQEFAKDVNDFLDADFVETTE